MAENTTIQSINENDASTKYSVIFSLLAKNLTYLNRVVILLGFVLLSSIIVMITINVYGNIYSSDSFVNPTEDDDDLDKDLSQKNLERDFPKFGSYFHKLHTGINSQLSTFKSHQQAYSNYMFGLEMLTAFLGALAVIMTGMDKVRPGWAHLAIIPMGMVTLTATLSAVLDPNDGYLRSTVTRAKLSTLQHEVQFELRMMKIDDKRDDAEQEEFLRDKYKELDSILQEDLLRFLSDTKETNSGQKE